MAMSSTTLGELVIAHIKADVPALVNMDSDAEKIYKAIAKSVVEYIQSNAVVNFPIPVQVDIATGIGATTATGTIS